MALLASCWLIVESFVVPRGFLKWFYLSFYIHPVFLVFCQVFLWLNELKKLLIFFFYPLKVAFRISLFVFGLIQRVVLFLFSYIRPTRVDLYYDALEPDFAQLRLLQEHRQIFVSCSKVRIGFYPNLDTYEATEEKYDDSCLKDSWLNDYLLSDHYSTSSCSNDSVTQVLLDQHKCTTFVVDLKSSDEESDQDSLISPSKASEPLLLEDMLALSLDDDDDSVSVSAADVLVDEGYSMKQEFVKDIAAFHQKYSSRVRFFDVLYHERLHGINAILNEHLSSSNLPNCIGQSTDSPMQHAVWSRTARKRVLRSLECDLEMICVGQSCLFWEALDHQYHKVESLALSDNYGNILFDHNISGKFQQLEILLERFVEDERCECKGSSSNTSKKISFQTLLQVPDVTGFVLMGEQNKTMSEDYCMRPTQLLEAIDNCIKAFWSYIKTDEKKSIWNYKGIWRDHPLVEDPQDLELLYDVVKNLRKKGIMLRNMQGKSKCWMRRKVKPVAAENEKRNLVVAMIDVKLVQRILKMSLISKSHLKWCQQKLDNIDFKQDIIFRGRVSQLFPSS